MFWFILLFPFIAQANLPTQAAVVSEDVDKMYNFIHGLSLFFGLLIISVFVIFSFLYKRKNSKEQATAKVHHNLYLEIFWSAIPFCIFMFMFSWGLIVYNKMRAPYKNALEIHVYGQMWNWEYVYKSGKRATDALYVPVNTPVKLIMTSRDVIHSFFVPAFRMKQDILPNRYTSFYFTAVKKGLFNIFCAEYCGTGHYNMLSKVHVMSLKDWEKWLASDPYEGLSLVEVGEKVFQGRCTACHKINSDNMIGPGLGGIFNSVREFDNGKSSVADEEYLRESILNPSLKIVKGFADQMTPFAGLLQEEEMVGLIEYIKSLK